MDATELRANAARVSDQLAALAEHGYTAPTFTTLWEAHHASGVQDVARWLSTGDISPNLQRLLDAVESRIRTPGGSAPG